MLGCLKAYSLNIVRTCEPSQLRSPLELHKSDPNSKVTILAGLVSYTVAEISWDHSALIAKWLYYRDNGKMTFLCNSTTTTDSPNNDIPIESGAHTYLSTLPVCHRAVKLCPDVDSVRSGR